jgi:pyruvyl transferase EpsO
MTVDECTAARDRLAASLKARLHAILDDLLPRDARVALLDYPDSENVGDNAIWLGELRWLHESGRTLVYACARDDYNPHEVRRRLGSDGVVLIHGGGNFGDLYPVHDELRFRILQDFPDHKIIQLPQTINYRDAGAAGKAARAFASHPDVTLIVRDEPSVDRAERLLGVQAILCPDMAFGLGALRRREPVQEVTWLARRDKERVGPVPRQGEGVEAVDWLDTKANTFGFRLARQINTPLAASAGSSRVAARLVQTSVRANYQRLAEGRLTFGMRMISTGRVLVTDRLHAHILAVLAGIPNVLVSDRYGKTRDVHYAWTRESSTWLAEGHDAALALAAQKVTALHD